jgi:hypothetical protein
MIDIHMDHIRVHLTKYFDISGHIGANRGILGHGIEAKKTYYRGKRDLV